jgi:hypothetical protein
MAAEIPEENLAYPVLATIGQVQGSGFFLNDQQAAWFIRAVNLVVLGAPRRSFPETNAVGYCYTISR